MSIRKYNQRHISSARWGHRWALAVVNEAEVVQQMKVVGVESVGAGPDDFDWAIKSETKRVAKVVKATGIKLD